MGAPAGLGRANRSTRMEEGIARYEVVVRIIIHKYPTDTQVLWDKMNGRTPEFEEIDLGNFDDPIVKWFIVGNKIQLQTGITIKITQVLLDSPGTLIISGTSAFLTE